MERGETEGSAAHETSPPRYCTHAPALAASRSSRSACDMQNVRAHVHMCTSASCAQCIQDLYQIVNQVKCQVPCSLVTSTVLPVWVPAMANTT